MATFTRSWTVRLIGDPTENELAMVGLSGKDLEDHVEKALVDHWKPKNMVALYLDKLTKENHSMPPNQHYSKYDLEELSREALRRDEMESKIALHDLKRDFKSLHGGVDMPIEAFLVVMPICAMLSYCGGVLLVLWLREKALDTAVTEFNELDEKTWAKTWAFLTLPVCLVTVRSLNGPLNTKLDGFKDKAENWVGRIDLTISGMAMYGPPKMVLIDGLRSVARGLQGQVNETKWNFTIKSLFIPFVINMVLAAGLVLLDMLRRSM